MHLKIRSVFAVENSQNYQVLYGMHGDAVIAFEEEMFVIRDHNKWDSINLSSPCYPAKLIIKLDPKIRGGELNFKFGKYSGKGFLTNKEAVLLDVYSSEIYETKAQLDPTDVQKRKFMDKSGREWKSDTVVKYKFEILFRNLTEQKMFMDEIQECFSKSV